MFGLFVTPHTEREKNVVRFSAAVSGKERCVTTLKMAVQQTTLNWAFLHFTDFKRGKYSFSSPIPSMQCCATVRATYIPTLNGGDRAGVWNFSFSEVTLSEYNVSTVLLPIVGIFETTYIFYMNQLSVHTNPGESTHRNHIILKPLSRAVLRPHPNKSRHNIWGFKDVQICVDMDLVASSFCLYLFFTRGCKTFQAEYKSLSDQY